MSIGVGQRCEEAGQPDGLRRRLCAQLLPEPAPPRKTGSVSSAMAGWSTSMIAAIGDCHWIG